MEDTFFLLQTSKKPKQTMEERLRKLKVWFSHLDSKLSFFFLSFSWFGSSSNGCLGLLANVNEEGRMKKEEEAVAGGQCSVVSEEAAIRIMEPDAENIYAPAGGEPVVIRVREGKF